jgi:YfiH family protein
MMSDPWQSIDMGPGVRALQTERAPGPLPYGGFNLGLHVGDEVSRVTANRARLSEFFGVEPIFANQVHGVHLAEVSAAGHSPGDADALLTRMPGVAIGMLTADCLPVLFRTEHAIAVAHAGWRGLVGGVLESVVTALGDVSSARVWLGPCIGHEAFEVGPEVFKSFMSSPFFLAADVDASFSPGERDRLHADLQMLARNQLAQLGCESISVEKYCTFSQPDLFYSYRRDGVTGRHGALIWINTN